MNLKLSFPENSNDPFKWDIDVWTKQKIQELQAEAWEDGFFEGWDALAVLPEDGPMISNSQFSALLAANPYRSSSSEDQNPSLYSPENSGDEE